MKVSDLSAGELFVRRIRQSESDFQDALFSGVVSLGLNFDTRPARKISIFDLVIGHNRLRVAHPERDFLYLGSAGTARKVNGKSDLAAGSPGCAAEGERER